MYADGGKLVIVIIMIQVFTAEKNIIFHFSYIIRILCNTIELSDL